MIGAHDDLGRRLRRLARRVPKVHRLLALRGVHREGERARHRVGGETERKEGGTALYGYGMNAT